MCAEQPLVMPGENPDLLINKINRYVTQHGAETEAECDAAEYAAINYVRWKRCHKSDVAAESRVVDGVAQGFNAQQAQKLDDLILELATSPAATIGALTKFSFGLLYMIEQLAILEDQLRVTRSLHPGQRLDLIHLCGCRPSDLFTSEIIKEINISYLSGLHGPGKLSAEEAALIFQNDRPLEVGPEEFQRRLGAWLRELVDSREGQARLREIVADLKAGLQEQLKEVIAREDDDRAKAVEAAKVSVNHECMLRMRYMRESGRAWQAGLDLVHQLRLARLKHPVEAAAAPAEATAPPEPASAAPEAAPTPPPAGTETAHRTEAAAPEVAGNHGGNGEPRAYSFVDIAISRPDGAVAGQPTMNETPDRPGFGDLLHQRE
jgi:hypothetical protein